jgi:hypothetical protein
MRNDVDCIKLRPVLYGPCYLPQRRFFVGQDDRLNIGPDAGQQYGKIVHIAVNEDDFTLGHGGHEDWSPRNGGAAAGVCRHGHSAGVMKRSGSRMHA